MIKYSELETFKTFAQLQISLIPNGAIYLIIENNTIVWELSSSNLNIESLKVGKKVSSDGAAIRSMNERKTVTIQVPREVYGTRLIISGEPIADDNNNVVGAISIAFPKVHSVVSAFPHFAPILSEMLMEGVVLYVTDLHKCILKQGSKKFDIESFHVGYELKDTDVAYKTIRSKNFSIAQLDDSAWGVPLLIMNYPLMDDLNPNEIVGTFGITLPKGSSLHLKQMSDTLNSGLTGIANSIEQLSQSANKIYNNECSLNSTLKEVYKLSEEINSISSFLEGVSNQTKMLGLNASIEAARAGEVGKGFNVVASEIRKLSDQSKSTVPKIKLIINNIKSKVSDVSKLSATTLESSQEQSAASEEITSSIEEMTVLSSELNTLSKNI